MHVCIYITVESVVRENIATRGRIVLIGSVSLGVHLLGVYVSSQVSRLWHLLIGIFRLTSACIDTQCFLP